MRSGDFSAVATPSIRDVHGQRQHPDCRTFPGNSIPTNRIHPTSQQLLEFYPEPNTSGSARFNYLSEQNRTIDRKQSTQRMDFVQDAASTWMGRHSYGHDDEVTPALKLNGTKLLNSVHQVMIGNTRTLSPSVLNEFRFGFNSFFNTYGRELGMSATSCPNWAFPASPLVRQSRGAFRPSSSPGITASETARRALHQPEQVFEFVDNLSWIRGTHSFKLGGSIRFDQFNQDGNQFSRGSFQFDGRATGSFTGAATPGAAAFADFLLGYQRSEAARALATTKFRAISQAYHFNDTWRMREHDARLRAAL